MNREIKFRAWDKFENKMILWEEMIKDTESEKLIPEILLNQTRYIPLQFLSKDKDGIDLYDGDIVEKEDPDYWKERNHIDEQDIRLWRGGTGIIVILNGGVYIEEINCGEWCFNGPEGGEWGYWEIKKIGNKYENSELLKT